MKNWRDVVLVGIATLIVLYGCGTTSATNCPPPRKPNSVPDLAVWEGNCDGGNWIELVSVKAGRFRFRIYEARRGNLLLDADFEYRDCDAFRLTEANWTEHIINFGYALELGHTPEAEYGPRCRLEPVYPAYQQTN